MEKIGAYDFILDIIEHGYKLPFYSTPPSVYLPNNRSAVKHSDFVVQAIGDLLSRGLIVECSERPFVVNPLTVSVQNSCKKRLILDVRHVNKHLWKTSFKFEDIRTAMLYIKEHYFCFKFDLHSAYHHVDIFENHTTFLGFAWSFKGKVRFYKFSVLPFGLSSACNILTKITRPLVKKWRGEGKQVLMYLDDGLGCHSDKDACLSIAMEIKQDLIDSGFVPKVEKSMWFPCQDLVFLGYHLHLQSGIVTIPECRVSKLRTTISDIDSSLQSKGTVHVRKKSFVGQVISMSYVLGNIVYIMTKCLSIDILNAVSWNHSITLNEESSRQIEFWKINVDQINHKRFCNDHSCNTIVFSDASNTGYGGYIVENPLSTAHGMWSEKERTQSSTWRELVAVSRILSSLVPFLHSKRIKWFSDNKNVVSIVEKGSMKANLQDIVLSIFTVCLTNNISLSVEWIPHTENNRADHISRIIDNDDWGISQNMFDYIDALWGPHEIDFFCYR